MFDSIKEWFVGIFQDMAKSSVDGFVEAVNKLPSKASDMLSQTPQNFNNSSNVFDTVRQISINVIVPIAVIILTLVVCYDFISSFMNRSTKDMDLEVVFKLCFKLFIGIFLLNHVFDYTTAVFTLGEKAVNGIIESMSGSDYQQSFAAVKEEISNKIDDLGVGSCLLVSITALICTIIQWLCNQLVSVIVIARMLEIYMYCSISPIPFATLTNREWGGIGTNFIKNLFALAFQAFFMELCLVMYNTLVQGALLSADSLVMSLFECVGLSLMIVFTMFKCGSISKSIFNAA